MGVGIPEITILGIIALLFFGGKKISSSNKKKNKNTASVNTSRKEVDTTANFQNMNTEYDNVSPLEEASEKEKA